MPHVHSCDTCIFATRLLSRVLHFRSYDPLPASLCRFFCSGRAKSRLAEAPKAWVTFHPNEPKTGSSGTPAWVTFHPNEPKAGSSGTPAWVTLGDIGCNWVKPGGRGHPPLEIGH